MPIPRRSIELTQVTEWDDGTVRPFEDCLAAEEPLEIRIGAKPIVVTMRTPGHDKELAAGFLWTEGIIDSPRCIVAIKEADGKSNVVEVDLDSAFIEADNLQRNFYAASSCGICGKASIDAIRLRGLHSPNSSFKVSPAMLCALPDQILARQQVLGRTGGLHAAAIFDAKGEMLAMC
jgi:FdhD protein